MKRAFLTICIILIIYSPVTFSQADADTSVFLITCGPGTETYSIYGHSALRIVIPQKEIDDVYNWGVFDFNTPNFAWKFAKGRLDYMLGVEPLQSFLQTYFFEQRFVYSQKINLTSEEIKELISLINVNLKPENVRYKYDFFYDDCSTRIRDLLEKSIGKKLLYPLYEDQENPTFREMVGKYQDPFPWLKFGIDLIMGSPGDKDASARDRMFLPIDMKYELDDTRIIRDGKMIPLLQNPEVILDFNSPQVRQKLFTSPVMIFALLLVLMIILTGLLRNRKSNRIFDIIIYSVFSLLALLMIFFNFFTDHEQMRWNLNIIWLNPVILLCLAAVILNKKGLIFFRLLFIISVTFFVLRFILPQDFNSGINPLVIILILRSSVRSEYGWNPLSLK